jgi:hypothetical protein
MSSASLDFSEFARRLSGKLSGQAGKLRDAASGYEHGDAAGARTVSGTRGPR